jgi:hypothetical protein
MPVNLDVRAEEFEGLVDATEMAILLSREADGSRIRNISEVQKADLETLRDLSEDAKCCRYKYSAVVKATLLEGYEPHPGAVRCSNCNGKKCAQYTPRN